MTTYGCNVLYRDYMPDYLISMDWPVVLEILENDIHHRTNFYTQDNANFNHMSVDEKERINWLKNMARRLDSGNSALEVALDHEYETIYIIGFDYNNDDKLPNVYHGTKNYAVNSSVLAATSMANEWRNRLRKLVREYPDTNIIRVTNINNITIESQNYNEITPKQFKEIYE